MRFRSEQRLRRQGDFRAIREQGRRRDCGAFTLWWLRRPQSETVSSAAAPLPGHPVELPRVGVVASIASVGPAVRRNRAKRRLREIFRAHQQLVPPGCDLLLVARASLNRLAYGELEQKFVDACHKIFPPPNA